VGAEVLRMYLAQKLPEYMVPAAYVKLETLPLTPNGKLDRKVLPMPQTSIEEDVSAVAPRNDVEAVLLKIWQQLLGADSIGRNDNFFEVGGHSLLAVRLVMEIQKATGKQVPLATLFQSFTIESLTRVLRTETMAPEQVVLQIQGEGSKPPFFTVVVPGMNALGYIALARHLGADQPLYRIQGPGARIKQRSYSRTEFEGLAAEYIKAMKTIQPHGPYYLGGMCEGARIAFDMARLLEAQNEEVAFLAIFDTWVLENSQIRLLWKVDYYWTRLKQFKGLSFERKRKYVVGWFQRRVKPAPKPVSTGGTPWRTAYWPAKDFVPAKFGGKITVFKNPKQAYFYVRDPLMGWGTRTTVGVDLHEVNTKHGFFMREPYVRELAEKLSHCLRSRMQASKLKNEPSQAETAETGLLLLGDEVSS